MLALAKSSLQQFYSFCLLKQLLGVYLTTLDWMGSQVIWDLYSHVYLRDKYKDCEKVTASHDNLFYRHSV